MPERPSEVINSANIVLVGSFNPGIFQPQWFVRQRLMSEEQGHDAKIRLIAPGFSSFETDSFVIHVTEQQFIAASKPEASPAPLRDLVTGTFAILEHTPVTAMGLNCQRHVPMETEAEWHEIGDKLAPKECWNAVLEGRPGLLSMTILTNKAEPKGAQFRIKVEPSQVIRFGVYFETNEHYPDTEPDSLRRLMVVLNERWEESQNEASRIIKHILTWAKGS